MICVGVDEVACCSVEVIGIVDGFLEWEWVLHGMNQALVSHFDRLLFDRLVAFLHCLASARREWSQSLWTSCFVLFRYARDWSMNASQHQLACDFLRSVV